VKASGAIVGQHTESRLLALVECEVVISCKELLFCIRIPLISYITQTEFKLL